MAQDCPAVKGASGQRLSVWATLSLQIPAGHTRPAPARRNLVAKPDALDPGILRSIAAPEGSGVSLAYKRASLSHPIFSAQPGRAGAPRAADSPWVPSLRKALPHMSHVARKSSEAT